MAVCTIVATAGSASANSYSTIAEASDYHATHVTPATWTAATDDNRCRALQMATRLLDQRFRWNGSAASSTQALLWPRVGVVGPHGYLIANDTVPLAVKRATAELARQLLEEDTTGDSATSVQGLKSITAGPISLEFKSVSSKPITDAVAAFLTPYYGTLVGVGGGAVTMLRA